MFETHGYSPPPPAALGPYRGGRHHERPELVDRREPGEYDPRHRSGVFHWWRMVVKSEYLDFILEQLAGAGRITSRRMFGGFGLYADDVFFAIISRDVLFFKVGDGNRTDYAARGMRQFQPLRDKPHLSMSYYEVPADILEDADECSIWVRRAVAAALETKSARAPRNPAAKRVTAKSTRKPRS